MGDSGNYFQRGFGLKDEAAASVVEHYASELVDLLRSRGGRLSVGRVTFRLAKEFGFCYGVERAVEYAYETRAKFPDRRVFLTNELIHNPHVNGRMRRLGIEFLQGYDDVRADDVVIIPAFGVTMHEMALLRERGCVMVDTTCGSVLNVWKNVDRYARDGFTTVIHGKHVHEETRATCSRAESRSHYVVVRDMDEAELVAGYVEGRLDATELLGRLGPAVSAGFEPARDLERVGLANQTTMLMSESLAIAERLRRAFVARHGEDGALARFRTFDTICSATQERQDAVARLLEEPIDVMIVVGGFNSSNTNHLAEMCEGRVAAFHIQDEAGIVDGHRIEYQPAHRRDTVTATAWLPEGDVVVGITAGASTPNNKVGLVMERILRVLSIPLPDVLAAAQAG